MNKKKTQCKLNNMMLHLVLLVCAMTNISQMPLIVNTGYTRYFSTPLWFGLAVVSLLILKVIPYSHIKKLFFLVVAFALYFFIASLMNNNYFNSELPYPIFLAFFVLFIGYLVGRFLTIDDTDEILTVYVISSTLVCIDVFKSYVLGVDMEALTYAYASKNSVSQILLSAWIIILLRKFGKVKGFIKNLYYILYFILLTITLLGLKSRATIIGIPIVIFWVLIHGKLDRKVRYIIILIVIMAVILLSIKPQYYDMLVNNILLGNRSASSLDDLSSGRYSQWENFGNDFKNNWLFGQGSAARESLILTALLEFGIIGGSMIFSLALSPLVWCLTKFKRSHPFYLFFSSLAITYITNGIFEQLAPFGPGVKCYLLWFLFGIFLNDHMNRSLYEEKMEVWI